MNIKSQQAKNSFSIHIYISMQSVFATCFRNSIERSYNNRYLGSHCHCIQTCR